MPPLRRLRPLRQRPLPSPPSRPHLRPLPLPARRCPLPRRPPLLLPGLRLGRPQLPGTPAPPIELLLRMPLPARALPDVVLRAGPPALQGGGRRARDGHHRREQREHLLGARGGRELGWFLYGRGVWWVGALRSVRPLHGFIVFYGAGDRLHHAVRRGATGPLS